jgi:hypothetical protein
MVAPQAPSLRSFLASEESDSSLVSLENDSKSTTQSKTSMLRRLNPFKRGMSMRKINESSSISIREDWNLEAGVSFAQTVKVVTIPSLDDYTEEEILSVWFTHEEYQSFMHVAERTIDKMIRRRPLKKNNYCFRGLETMVEENYEAKGERRAEAFHAVFNEQRAQYERGEGYNPEAIAKSYTPRTKKSQTAAQAAARQDEYEVDISMECDVFVGQVLHQMAFQHWIKKIMAEGPESKSSMPEILDKAIESMHTDEELKEDQPDSGIEEQDFSEVLKTPLKEVSDASARPSRGLGRRISLRNLVKQDSLKNTTALTEARKQRFLMKVLD